MAREYRLQVLASLVSILVEAQTLEGLEGGVRLGATESELEASLCHCLTPGGGVYSAKS